MVDFSEILLKLQLREAHHCIQAHLSKGHKYAQFLSLMFLRHFPAIMDNEMLVNWDTIRGVFDRVPLFPIIPIDAEILDHWYTHPGVWEVACNMHHSQHVLAMVHHTLPAGNKDKPAIIYGASFVYVLTHQAWTSLSDALSYLRHSKQDCVILVSTPVKLTYSPQPQGKWYFTLLPINGDPNADHGPLSSFAAATLHTASWEGQSSNMAIQIKLPPCFGSSKWPKTELIMETVLSRSPLWQNTHFMERKSSSEIIVGQDGQPLCQELEISLCIPGGNMSTHPTIQGIHPH